MNQTISFRLRAIEDDIIGKKAHAAMSDAFPLWRDSSDGDVLGITRRMNVRMGEGSILSDFSLLVRHEGGLMLRSYDDLHHKKRTAYADAVIMSGLETAGTFLVRRMRSVSYYTMGDPYEFELTYLHGALLFGAYDPIDYYTNYVAPLEGTKKFNDSFAPIGTVIVPPSMSAHERLARISAVEDSCAIYERHNSLSRHGTTLVALPALTIEPEVQE